MAHDAAKIHKLESRHAAPIGGNALELTRIQSFVDGDEDIFDILARQKNRYSDDKNLHNAVDTTISALKNAQERIETLEDMRTHDELTGLLNAKGFNAAAAREVARAKRKATNAPVCLTLQLENMDSITRQYGPQATHMALKLLAYSLGNEARATDIRARLSADEFVLLFVDTNPENALARIQKLNLTLNKLSFTWQRDEIALHVSLSMQEYVGQSRKEPDRLDALKTQINKQNNTHDIRSAMRS